jgi:uncharacterized membrane protein SpoIIM required for sporulation
MKIAEVAYNLAEDLKRISNKQLKLSGQERLQSAFGVITGYDTLASRVYEERNEKSYEEYREGKAQNNRETLLSDFLLRILSVAPQNHRQTKLYRQWKKEYQRIWKANFELFLLAVTLFLMTGVLGWIIGMKHQEYVPVLIPQNLLENILDQNAWFDRINENPLFEGLRIAWNNIRVSINCLLGGAILGFGGLYFLAYNGLTFGTIFGFCAANNFDQALTRFVSGHGPLELTIIIASSFASFIYGRVFFMRPYSLFAVRMKVAFKEAFTIAVGVIPWLVLAAVIEAGVSPVVGISYQTKLIIGALAAALFWIWTFFPAPKSSLEAS